MECRYGGRQPDAGSLTIRGTWQDALKGIVINADGADHVGADALTYRTVVPPHGHWSAVLSVVPAVDGTGPAAPIVHPAPGDMSPRDRRRMEWVARIPVLQMGNGSVERTLQRSCDDLARSRSKTPTIRTGWWSPPGRPGS